MVLSKSVFAFVIVLVLVFGSFTTCLLVRSMQHDTSGRSSSRATATPAATLGNEKTPDIDLISATVYGKRVFSLSLDELTDWLGRPSSVNSPDIHGHGAYLPYAEKGLAFYFAHPDDDQRQTCRSFVAFLASTHTSKEGGPFQAFTGTLNYGLDGTWKAKDVMKAFVEYKPHDSYDAGLASLEAVAKDMDATLRKMGKAPDLTTSDIPSINRINIFLSNEVVEFQYEENTKFIERILVADHKSPASQ